MLIYRKTRLAFGLLSRLSGSAIPRAVVPALVSAAICAYFEWALPTEVLSAFFDHPYPFQVFAYIVAFALVFRTNQAYARYWEMRTYVAQMCSKLGDAAMLALVFEELIAKPEEAGNARRSQALIVHRFSLLHAISLQYLRRDNALSNLSSAATGDANVESCSKILCREFCGDQDDPIQHEAYVASRPLPVLGGLDDKESLALSTTDDRVGFVSALLVGQLSLRRQSGGLAAEAPVYTRVLHTLSDGVLGFQKARKIEDTPFPFPYAQLLAFMLYCFALSYPLLAASKMGGTAQIVFDPSEWEEHAWAIALSHVYAPVLTFVVVLSYFGLHEVARTLEDPFIHPPNDLPATHMQEDFNGRLLASWEAATAAFASELIPEAAVDALTEELEERCGLGAPWRENGKTMPSPYDASSSAAAVMEAVTREAAKASPRLSHTVTKPNRFWDAASTSGAEAPCLSRNSSSAGLLSARSAVADGSGGGPPLPGRSKSAGGDAGWGRVTLELT